MFFLCIFSNPVTVNVLKTMFPPFSYVKRKPNIAMKSFSTKNLWFGVDSKLQIPPLMYVLWSKNNRYFQFFQKVFFNPRIVNSCCFDFPFIALILAKCFLFIGVFSFWKRKKSAGAKSGEYSGWGTLLKRTFWYRQQLLFWLSIYLLNPSKILSFHRCV